MNINPQDYNREERKRSSWWSSRHSSAEDSGAVLKRLRKLTLIDLLLLLVMMGVLIPWVLQMDSRIDAGPYKVRLDERRSDGSLVLILRITLSRGTDTYITAGDKLGWKIFDEDGFLLHEEFDIPPISGKSREFIYLIDRDGIFSCEIIAGNEILTIQIDDE